LCFILLLIGGFMIDNYRGAGFALCVATFLWLFRKKAHTAFRAVRHKFEKTLPALPALIGREANGGSLSQPVKVLAGATAILAGLFLIPMELRVWGEFKILPLLNTDVRAEGEGIVTEIHVKEADVVKQGDLIARLSDRDLSAELRRTEAQVGQVRARLKMLEAGPRQEDIEVARRAVETARTMHEKALKQYEEAQHLRAERLANAKTAMRKSEELVGIKKGEFERLKEGLEAGFISRKEFDNAHEAMTVRTKELEAGRGELELIVADDLAQLRKDIAVNEKQLEEAKSKLRVLLAGSRQEEIEGAEAEIASLEAQQAYVKEQIRLLNVISPISGLITTPTRQLRELIGQRVAKGDLLAEVHELRTVTAEIAVSEQEIGDVQVGQPVVLKVRAYPGMTFEGKVRSIATTADERIDGVKGSTVLVSTQLDNTSLLLKPDMTGNAKIYCGSRQLIDIVTRRIARYFKVEFWSWW
jgi:multidrug resistance efflux pump